MVNMNKEQYGKFYLTKKTCLNFVEKWTPKILALEQKQKQQKYLLQYTRTNPRAVRFPRKYEFSV